MCGKADVCLMCREAVEVNCEVSGLLPRQGGKREWDIRHTKGSEVWEWAV